MLENDRYKVHLPSGKLPDNYELSIKQLSNLFKLLSQDPEVLKEYDSVLKEQLKNVIHVVTLHTLLFIII